jgi:hypothetical protein
MCIIGHPLLQAGEKAVEVRSAGHRPEAYAVGSIDHGPRWRSRVENNRQRLTFGEVSRIWQDRDDSQRTRWRVPRRWVRGGRWIGV